MAIALLCILLSNAFDIMGMPHLYMGFFLHSCHLSMIVKIVTPCSISLIAFLQVLSGIVIKNIEHKSF